MEKSRLWTRSPGYAALLATAALGTSASAAARPSTSTISRFILPFAGLLPQRQSTPLVLIWPICAGRTSADQSGGKLHPSTEAGSGAIRQPQEKAATWSGSGFDRGLQSPLDMSQTAGIATRRHC